MKIKFSLILQTIPLLLSAAIFISAQTEVLTNADVVAMSRAGLQSEVIIEKINSSESDFDTTAKSLIALKTEKVDDKIIAAVIEKARSDEKLKTRRVENVKTGNTELSEAAPAPTRNVEYKTAAQILRDAKTIAFKKDSAYPKIKELESSLLKQARLAKWNRFNLTITEYEADADLLVEIGHDFGTHYNFRVLDVKTGRVIAASGVTSLGGALAGNVADKLIKRLNEIISAKQ